MLTHLDTPLELAQKNSYFYVIGGEYFYVGTAPHGWCFILRTKPSIGLKTIQDWKKVLDGKRGIVVDQYHNAYFYPKIMSIITLRGYKTSLRRSPIGQNYCVGHGEGPWDYYCIEDINNWIYHDLSTFYNGVC